MRGGGVKMSITIHHLHPAVYVLNMLYMKAMLCIALALSHSLSHTALNREVLCDHTHHCQVLSQCQTFEPFPCRRPVGFCPPV